MDEKKDEKVEQDREKLPEPDLPTCEKCGKNPFDCPCGTWEDLDK